MAGPKEEAELSAKRALDRKIMLETKTWPQVMSVFGYHNGRVARKSAEEFKNLKDIFANAGHAHIAAFIEFVHLREGLLNTALSFNLSMRRRSVPGDAPLTHENAALFFECPDILVGTRRGVESAFHWFNNLSEVMSTAAPESVQIFDKIFEEALEFVKIEPRRSTVDGMVREVLSIDRDIPKVPFDAPFEEPSGSKN